MSGNGDKGSGLLDPATTPNPIVTGDGSADAQTLSLVLFSGTDDKLEAAAVLIAGAAAMERPVNVLLQYWALEAFETARIREDHGLSAEASPAGTKHVRGAEARPGHQHWSDILRQAKEIGDVTIGACAKSMETFGLEMGDLDSIVDGVNGVASFLSRASGPVTFI